MKVARMVDFCQGQHVAVGRVLTVTCKRGMRASHNASLDRVVETKGMRSIVMVKPCAS